MSTDIKLCDRCYFYLIISATIYTLVAISFSILSTVFKIQYNENIIMFLGICVIIFDSIMLFIIIKSKLNLTKSQSLFLGLFIPLALYLFMGIESIILNIILMFMAVINLILSFRNVK